ncbi:MAG: DNA topoisomerase I [Parcubacteria group bacterium Gr01-1014_38]|nr:MAG: DNA topoisomerase I [Parcubacteria group bacterium Gr01-1014_38]
MHLVIVESPAKARTIERYLGKEYRVVSSYGHVRDLPKREMGVDVGRNFQPRYVVPPKARPVVARLKKEAGKATIIYFATDEDREGEAIAWHLQELLAPDPTKVRRITFDEITERAIKEALKSPRGLNFRLVDAQQARRILDRLVGYELSPFLWKKVQRGLSAGRVQSVAVRLIVEREREIEKFTPEEYWSIEADLHAGEGRSTPLEAPLLTGFTARLRSKDGAVLDKLAIRSKEDADAVVREAEPGPWMVTIVEEKVVHRSSSPPFTTSTLQQAASNQLGFSASRTMRGAQRLYEGVDLGEEGPTALITYMRTDSVNLATEAVSALRGVIAKHFGDDFLPQAARRYVTKTKGAQEAHEAIRPIDPQRAPERVKGYLDRDEYRLYDLIWRQAVASQMADAAFRAMTVDISANAYGFRATGSRIEFLGYLKVAGTRAIKETILPRIRQGETLTLETLRPLQHTTQPPPRYTEASLVRSLEQEGIGRPSTYAPTIETIQERGYVTKGPDRRFHPTDIGTIVNDVLVEHFPDIVDIKFTARMESNLDEIARGEREMVPVLQTFYEPFHKNLEQKTTSLTKRDLTTKPTNLTCPNCGKPLVERLGKRGRFLGCTGYPECAYTAPLSEEEKEAEQLANGKTCPQCGSPLAAKRSKFGVFLGCSTYPKCKHTERIEQKTGVKCPACKEGDIVARRGARGRTFYGCSRYPQCTFTLNSRPTGELCPNCGSLLVHGREEIRCSNKECDFRREISEAKQTPVE